MGIQGPEKSDRDSIAAIRFGPDRSFRGSKGSLYPCIVPLSVYKKFLDLSFLFFIIFSPILRC